MLVCPGCERAGEGTDACTEEAGAQDFQCEVVSREDVTRQAVQAAGSKTSLVLLAPDAMLFRPGGELC